MTNVESNTVLIVDDSEVMREMIKDVLVAGGLNVVGEATDGDDALEKYKKLKPKLVTMDVVMPSKHGIDAIKTIMEFDSEACIIVVSGLHQKSLVMNALEAGARDYLVKPFESEELLTTVQRNIASV